MYPNRGATIHLGREDFPVARANTSPMPDLAAMLVRSSIGTLAATDESCGECRRTPLAGERVHELEGGRILCDLCFAELPEDRRLAVRTERVHVSERRLSVVRRAA